MVFQVQEDLALPAKKDIESKRRPRSSLAPDVWQNATGV